MGYLVANGEGGVWQKDFESGQMGLKTVKWAYSGVHLSQTMWSHARNQ